MKKSLLFVLTFMTFLIFSESVNAYTYTLTPSSSTVTVGSNVSVTLYTDDVMGFYQINSSNTSVLAGTGGDAIDTGTAYSKTYTFTAKSVGSATITVSPTGAGLNVYSSEEPLYNRSVTINVVEKNVPKQIDVNRTYKSSNYLKSLVLEGYDISFDKDTLEYSVELEPGTEKVNISASVEDGSASVKGVGEVSVSEGANTIEITVTAENGNERVYKIVATVEEKDPIEVTIDKNKYRVVKKENLISDREGYERITVKINEFDIPALYNEVTKVTLVALKDEEGTIKLFSYNTKNGEYSEYNEFSFDVMNLFIHEDKNSKYQKKIIKINDVRMPAYKINGIHDYYLLYATNTSTGYEGYYLYDIKENSAQRYDTTMLERIAAEKDKYFTLVIVLSCVCFLSMLFLLIEVNKYHKKRG